MKNLISFPGVYKQKYCIMKTFISQVGRVGDRAAYQNHFLKIHLYLEVNVIGYKGKGESIVFFVKADEDVVFSGLVDCYEKDSAACFG